MNEDVRQGVAHVADEAVGHLAGLFIHLAAKSILAAVCFIGEAGFSRQFNRARDAARALPHSPTLRTFDGSVFDDGFVEAH